MNILDENHQTSIQPHQLRQFQGLVTKLFQCCQERVQYQSDRFELPDAELRCLLLFEGERYLTSKNIARKMNVVKSRVTKIIDGLVKRDLVQRIKDPEDSRITLLSLTPIGHGKLQDINKFDDYIHHDVLMRMEPEQRKIMLTNLEILKASMEACKELMV
ncbi:MarR family transcriptional regulator [Deltaproteobacteria bacterium]|nr:MarR family transcriptional regulator [Deltaproteobacteria bacterium]